MASKLSVAESIYPRLNDRCRLSYGFLSISNFYYFPCNNLGSIICFLAWSVPADLRSTVDDALFCSRLNHLVVLLSTSCSRLNHLVVLLSTSCSRLNHLVVLLSTFCSRLNHLVVLLSTSCSRLNHLVELLSTSCSRLNHLVVLLSTSFIITYSP